MATTINRLSALDRLSAGDLFPVFDQSNGDARKVSLSLLLAFMQDNLGFAGSTSIQNESPPGDGFNIVVDSPDNIHLIITPFSPLTDGTVTLPGSAVDKQEVSVNCTKQISVLSVVTPAGGVAIIGAPTTLAANDFFKMRFDFASQTWYRTG